LKNKCCLYVIISIRFFSITICNLLIEFPSYIRVNAIGYLRNVSNARDTETERDCFIAGHNTKVSVNISLFM